MILLNDDCLSVIKSLPNNCVDMVLCDPPYGITCNDWDNPLPMDELWPELHRVCKPNAAMLFFSLSNFSVDLILSNRKEWRYKYIWQKNSPTGFLNANKMPLRTFEEINVFYRYLPTFNPVKTTGHSTYIKNRNSLSENYGKFIKNTTINTDGSRYPTDILNFPIVHNSIYKLHPTQKPVALLEYLIKSYTNPGETVFDPTMGVGSTGVAAVNLNRDFIGFEIEDKYFTCAEERIKLASASLLKEIQE